MNGVSFGLLSNLDNTFNNIITNLQQERLNENTYSLNWTPFLRQGMRFLYE